MHLEERRTALIRRILATDDVELLRVMDHLFTGWSPATPAVAPVGIPTDRHALAEDEILDAHLAVARARAEHLGRGEADLAALQHLVDGLRAERAEARR